MTWTTPTNRGDGTIITTNIWNPIAGAQGNFAHLFNGTYIKDGLIRLGNWNAEGTLSPDEKPSGLGTADKGFIFYASDFDRLFRWTGSAWEDMPGQQPRGAVEFFDTLTPGTGYQICNGSAVTISTASGLTTAVTVPDYSTAAYLKMKAASHTIGPTAASGLTSTDGSHSHTVNAHTHGDGTLGTGGPSATESVGAGAVSAASDTHTHTITGSTGSTSPGTDAQGLHSHSPNTLEVRRTELLAYFRL